VCTPHLGASTVEAQEDVSVEVSEVVIAALKVTLPLPFPPSKFDTLSLWTFSSCMAISYPKSPFNRPSFVSYSSFRI
jgi:hypothetical protein